MKILLPENSGPIRSAAGTRFLLDDGRELDGVISCDVRFRVDEPITATIQIEVTPESLEANPLLGLETLREAAEARGFKLVPIGWTRTDADYRADTIKKTAVSLAWKILRKLWRK